MKFLKYASLLTLLLFVFYVQLWYLLLACRVHVNDRYCIPTTNKHFYVHMYISIWHAWSSSHEHIHFTFSFRIYENLFNIYFLVYDISALCFDYLSPIFANTFLPSLFGLRSKASSMCKASAAAHVARNCTLRTPRHFLRRAIKTSTQLRAMCLKRNFLYSFTLSSIIWGYICLHVLYIYVGTCLWGTLRLCTDKTLIQI